MTRALVPLKPNAPKLSIIGLKAKNGLTAPRPGRSWGQEVLLLREAAHQGQRDVLASPTAAALSARRAIYKVDRLSRSLLDFANAPRPPSLPARGCPVSGARWPAALQNCGPARPAIARESPANRSKSFRGQAILAPHGKAALLRLSFVRSHQRAPRHTSHFLSQGGRERATADETNFEPHDRIRAWLCAHA